MMGHSDETLRSFAKTVGNRKAKRLMTSMINRTVNEKLGSNPTRFEVQEYKKTREFRKKLEQKKSENAQYQTAVNSPWEDPDIVSEYDRYKVIIEDFVKKGKKLKIRDIRKAYAGFRKEKEKVIIEEARPYMELLDGIAAQSARSEMIPAIEKNLSEGSLLTIEKYFRGNPVYVPVEPDSMGEEFTDENGFIVFRNWFLNVYPRVHPVGEWVKSALPEEVIGHIMDSGLNSSFLQEEYACEIEQAVKTADSVIDGYFTEERLSSLIIRNRRYGSQYRRKLQERRETEMLSEMMEERMPGSYAELFPLARERKRHFVLHVGPTNSGKTYEALEALKRAESGAYLAPLRLLAYEKYEELNRAGCPCSLLTGEEGIDVEEPRVISCTIEMADLSSHYEVAVIDEAQMIGDKFRGGSWTAAIVGINADCVHVCLAPGTEGIIISLIEECGDEYEIFSHVRKTPLEVEWEPFLFPEDVRDGDALIVFSKRSVLAVKAELWNNGITCSTIYGALPYDVRHVEAERFISSRTSVLVATDAIGMGMNLPIRRVVFLEMEKFDGEKTRDLRAEEIRQIGGRAGRYGKYEVGYVSSIRGGNILERALKRHPTPIKRAMVKMPEKLIGLPGKVSRIYWIWNQIRMDEKYAKADVSREIDLCRELEEGSDDKVLIYKYATIPFDEKNPDVRDLWMAMFGETLRGGRFNWRGIEPYYLENSANSSLDELESAYEICDLSYYYFNMFHDKEEQMLVMDSKRSIAARIARILQDNNASGRVCRECRCILPWNYPYGLCERCHRRIFRSWNSPAGKRGRGRRRS